jgi:hypothetical protein
MMTASWAQPVCAMTLPAPAPTYHQIDAAYEFQKKDHRVIGLVSPPLIYTNPYTSREMKE